MTLEWGDRTPPSDFFLRFGKLSNDRPKVTQITPQDLGKKPSSWGSGPVALGTLYPIDSKILRFPSASNEGVTTSDYGGIYPGACCVRY